MQDESETLDDWRSRVEASFAGQGLLVLLGAGLVHAAPGEADVVLPFRPEVAQHLGFFHGGVVATMLDVACGMAALTRMDAGHQVLTAEFKINFLAPALGGALIARGRVVKAGRVLTICTGNAWVQGEAGEQHVALMQATMAAVRNR